MRLAVLDFCHTTVKNVELIENTHGTYIQGNIGKLKSYTSHTRTFLVTVQAGSVDDCINELIKDSTTLSGSRDAYQ